MFDKHISDFNKSIIGLREFVDLIAPFLEAKQQEHSKAINSLIVSAMINDVLANKTKWKENEKEELIEKKHKIDADILKFYDGKPINVKVIKPTTEEKKEKKTNLKVAIESNKAVKGHFEIAAMSEKHIELLYKNSLISLLSSVEWFFSEILHFYYDKYPESAGIQKKTLSLTELKSFGTISDAEKYLIDIKIEEVLRGSFDSWLNLLKTELGLKLGYINSLENELIEIYQRRNILVHNGGKVNSIYLSKVLDPQQKLKLNDTAHIDKEYLDSSIRKLQKTFILIASELWKKLDKDDKKRGDVLTEIIYENLLKSRWDICEGLCHFLINDNKLEPIDRLVAQLNYWLCKKRSGQFDEIKNEIDSTDFNDKKEIFQLALYALKDDKKSFFETLPIALDSKQINIERLEEFPIFQEFRETEEYENFKMTSKHFKIANKKIEKIKTVKKVDNSKDSLKKKTRKSPKKEI